MLVLLRLSTEDSWASLSSNSLQTLKIKNQVTLRNYIISKWQLLHHIFVFPVLFYYLLWLIVRRKINIQERLCKKKYVLKHQSHPVYIFSFSNFLVFFFCKHKIYFSIKSDNIKFSTVNFSISIHIPAMVNIIQVIL